MMLFIQSFIFIYRKKEQTTGESVSFVSLGEEKLRTLRCTRIFLIKPNVQSEGENKIQIPECIPIGLTAFPKI